MIPSLEYTALEILAALTPLFSLPCIHMPIFISSFQQDFQNLFMFSLCFSLEITTAQLAGEIVEFTSFVFHDAEIKLYAAYCPISENYLMVYVCACDN